MSTLYEIEQIGVRRQADEPKRVRRQIDELSVALDETQQIGIRRQVDKPKRVRQQMDNPQGQILLQ